MYPIPRKTAMLHAHLRIRFDAAGTQNGANSGYYFLRHDHLPIAGSDSIHGTGMPIAHHIDDRAVVPPLDSLFSSMSLRLCRDFFSVVLNG